MTTFLIAPYSPEVRDAMIIKGLRTPSDLQIDPAEYKALLLQKWSGIRIDTSQYLLLWWFLPVTKEGAGIIGGLEEDQQTVFLDTPFDQFFFWHRSVIPAQHRLFLSYEGSWANLEVKSNTSLAEIQGFIGKTS